MKFAVLSDTHYVSREMIPGDKDEASLLRHKVNKAVFQKLAAQTELDTILITGDLVDNGDLVSRGSVRGSTRTNATIRRWYRTRAAICPKRTARRR